MDVPFAHAGSCEDSLISGAIARFQLPVAPRVAPRAAAMLPSVPKRLIARTKKKVCAAASISTLPVRRTGIHPDNRTECHS
jgi:hypothetical protein